MNYYSELLSRIARMHNLWRLNLDFRSRVTHSAAYCHGIGCVQRVHGSRQQQLFCSPPLFAGRRRQYFCITSFLIKLIEKFENKLAFVGCMGACIVSHVSLNTTKHGLPQRCLKWLCDLAIIHESHTRQMEILQFDAITYVPAAEKWTRKWRQVSTVLT